MDTKPSIKQFHHVVWFTTNNEAEEFSFDFFVGGIKYECSLLISTIARGATHAASNELIIKLSTVVIKFSCV